MLKDLILKAIDCIPGAECDCCPMNLLTADKRNACLEVKSVAETLRREERKVSGSSKTCKVRDYAVLAGDLNG